MPKFTKDQIKKTQLVVDTLNEAFNDDPEAFYYSMTNHVQCNKKLADHPFIQVGLNPHVKKGTYRVGTVGYMNGVLSALGLPRICIVFDDGNKPEDPKKFIGVRIFQDDLETK